MGQGRTRRLGVVERLGIRRCVTGIALACGCQADVYEMASGSLLAVIDTADDDCRNREHQPDMVIADDSARPSPPPVAPPVCSSTRQRRAA